MMPAGSPVEAGVYFRPLLTSMYALAPFIHILSSAPNHPTGASHEASGTLTNRRSYESTVTGNVLILSEGLLSVHRAGRLPQSHNLTTFVNYSQYSDTLPRQSLGTAIRVATRLHDGRVCSLCSFLSSVPLALCALSECNFAYH